MNPQDHIPELLKLAAKSPCSRDKRGAIVVRDGDVIGRGYNAPVGGDCSDGVCNVGMVRDLSGRNEHGYPRQERWTRSCGGHVGHAEAMAMRDALGAITMKMLTYASMHSDGADYQSMFVNLCAGIPLNGCELIHLNTSPSIENAKERKRAFERGQWDRLKGEITRPIPATMGIAKPSRRRGCPSCAVLASGFGVDAIWLLHEDGWQRWPMAEYAKLAGVA